MGEVEKTTALSRIKGVQEWVTLGWTPPSNPPLTSSSIKKKRCQKEAAKHIKCDFSAFFRGVEGRLGAQVLPISVHNSACACVVRCVCVSVCYGGVLKCLCV